MVVLEVKKLFPMIRLIFSNSTRIKKMCLLDAQYNDFNISKSIFFKKKKLETRFSSHFPIWMWNELTTLPLKEKKTQSLQLGSLKTFQYVFFFGM